MEHERQRGERFHEGIKRVLASLEVPKRIVFDTTALVNYLRHPPSETLLARLEGRAELATTIINVFELYLGAYKSKDVRRNLTAVKGLRSTLRVLNITDDSAEKAGRIMAQLQSRGQQIEIRDLFIGSICLEHGYAVLTQNLVHFKRIPELQVVSEKELLGLDELK